MHPELKVSCMGVSLVMRAAFDCTGKHGRD